MKGLRMGIAYPHPPKQTEPKQHLVPLVDWTGTEPEGPNPAKNVYTPVSDELRKKASYELKLQDVNCYYCGKPLLRKVVRKRPSCEACQRNGRAKRWRIDHVAEVVAEKVGKERADRYLARINEESAPVVEAPASTRGIVIDIEDEASMQRAYDRLIRERNDYLAIRDEASHMIGVLTRKIEAINVLLHDEGEYDPPFDVTMKQLTVSVDS